MENSEQQSDAAQRFDPLPASSMPTDFSISLDDYRKGGTEMFLEGRKESKRLHPMRGFEDTYTDIVDYIVRITHRIWEQKDIGYIYDTYSHDCRVWDDVGLQYGRDKIVADTVHTNNAIPDIRLVADEVIWAGDEIRGFHTSHRTMILGTNTGYSRFGGPTGKPIRLFCIANCVSRDNEIYLEHVQYDTAGMLKQLGLDPVVCAKQLIARREDGPFAPNFMACEPDRTHGQNKPPIKNIPDVIEDIEEFVHASFHTIWNRRNLSVLDQIYSPSIVYEGATGRVFRGIGQIKSFILSMLAMFPNMALTVDDLYWMGNPREGFLVAIRWGAVGAHRGNGPYGLPSGKEVHLWGITQWHIKDNKIQKEWTIFNEFGIIMQIMG
ncbi:MAG: ester cyclase [Paracoccaceae bacterium]|nr:ester cyclase [Paracoccaceae bacterium]MDE2759196.1 ester cyclase [Paracoccaceae bacterium]MDE2916002.1 ester cyclase [Paracoccaceae bacterium]MYJ87439.1 ester cyclase [Paracoccaceae bacterium]